MTEQVRQNKPPQSQHTRLHPVSQHGFSQNAQTPMAGTDVRPLDRQNAQKPCCCAS